MEMTTIGFLLGLMSGLLSGAPTQDQTLTKHRLLAGDAVSGEIFVLDPLTLKLQSKAQGPRGQNAFATRPDGKRLGILSPSRRRLTLVDCESWKTIQDVSLLEDSDTTPRLRCLYPSDVTYGAGQWWISAGLRDLVITVDDVLFETQRISLSETENGDVWPGRIEFGLQSVWVSGFRSGEVIELGLDREILSRRVLTDSLWDIALRPDGSVLLGDVDHRKVWKSSGGGDFDSYVIPGSPLVVRDLGDGNALIVTRAPEHIAVIHLESGEVIGSVDLSAVVEGFVLDDKRTTAYLSLTRAGELLAIDLKEFTIRTKKSVGTRLTCLELQRFESKGD